MLTLELSACYVRFSDVSYLCLSLGAVDKRTCKEEANGYFVRLGMQLAQTAGRSNHWKFGWRPTVICSCLQGRGGTAALSRTV